MHALPMNYFSVHWHTDPPTCSDRSNPPSLLWWGDGWKGQKPSYMSWDDARLCHIIHCWSCICCTSAARWMGVNSNIILKITYLDYRFSLLSRFWFALLKFTSAQFWASYLLIRSPAPVLPASKRWTELASSPINPSPFQLFSHHPWSSTKTLPSPSSRHHPQPDKPA